MWATDRVYDTVVEKRRWWERKRELVLMKLLGEAGWRGGLTKAIYGRERVEEGLHLQCGEGASQAMYEESRLAQKSEGGNLERGNENRAGGPYAQRRANASSGLCLCTTAVGVSETEGELHMHKTVRGNC